MNVRFQTYLTESDPLYLQGNKSGEIYFYAGDVTIEKLTKDHLERLKFEIEEALERIKNQETKE